MSSSGWLVKNVYWTSLVFLRFDVFSHIFIQGQKIEVKCKLEIRFTSTKFLRSTLATFFLWRIRKRR